MILSVCSFQSPMSELFAEVNLVKSLVSVACRLCVLRTRHPTMTAAPFRAQYAELQVWGVWAGSGVAGQCLERLPPSRYADFYHLHYFGKEGSSEQRGYIQEKKLIKQPWCHRKWKGCQLLNVRHRNKMLYTGLPLLYSICLIIQINAVPGYEVVIHTPLPASLQKKFPI